MVSLAGFHRFTRRTCPHILSSLFILIVLISPLLAAVPVSADWGPDVRLTNNPALSSAPRVAVSGNNVHVVWYDNQDGNCEIYYKRSLDGGNTWGRDTRLSTGTAGSLRPAIAASGNNIHVVWYDSRDGNWEIYYKHSLDGGNTWGPDTRLTNAAGHSSNPRVAVEKSQVHVVWGDDRNGNYEIFYKRSLNDGNTWGSDTKISTVTSKSANPILAVSGNTVHVVWMDDIDGSHVNIYYNHSIDAGTTWGTDTKLSIDTRLSINPFIAVLGENVHFVWIDFRDETAKIYYKRSLNGGTTWGSDTNLGTCYGVPDYHPSVSISGKNVHIAWSDGLYGNYYRESVDNGTTWEPSTSLGSGSGSPVSLSIAASRNNIHIVWQDNRDGNAEIYYKKFSAIPAITGVNPASGIQRETLAVTITGANFTGATAVNFGSGITINSFKVDNDSRITVNIVISPTAKVGFRDITVTTFQGTALRTPAFKILGQPTDTNPLIGSGSVSATPAAPPVALSNIVVQGASLSTAKVAPNTPITVTADVANKSTVNGNKKVTVYVNGEIETTESVTLDSGGASQLTFNITRGDPGTYKVYVDGTPAGSFTVDELAGPGPIIIGTGLLFLIIFAAFIFIFRRNSQFSR